MTPEQEYEFYANEEHREPRGAPRKRRTRTISISGMEHNPLSLIARAAHHARLMGWGVTWAALNDVYVDQVECFQRNPEHVFTLDRAILVLESCGLDVVGHRAPQLVQGADGVWRPTALV